MRLILFVAITLVISACSTSNIDSIDEKSVEFRIYANEKTVADLSPTKNEEYQFGLNSGATTDEAVKQREDLNKPIGNDAQIRINNNYPYTHCKNEFAIILTAKVDGKIIKPRSTGKGSRVKPGVHKVSVDLTALYKLNAKHYSTKTYEVFFGKKDVVNVSVKVPIKELSTSYENIKGFILINGANINLNERVTLKDDATKNPRCNKAWVIPG